MSHYWDTSYLLISINISYSKLCKVIHLIHKCTGVSHVSYCPWGCRPEATPLSSGQIDLFFNSNPRDRSRHCPDLDAARAFSRSPPAFGHCAVRLLLAVRSTLCIAQQAPACWRGSRARGSRPSPWPTSGRTRLSRTAPTSSGSTNQWVDRLESEERWWNLSGFVLFVPDVWHVWSQIFRWSILLENLF